MMAAADDPPAKSTALRLSGAIWRKGRSTKRQLNQASNRLALSMSEASSQVGSRTVR